MLGAYPNAHWPGFLPAPGGQRRACAKQPRRRSGRFAPVFRPVRLSAAPACPTGYPLAKNADDEARAAELRDIRAIAAGDQSAFARVIDRESPRLLRFSQGLLGSLEEAEDVVQETLIGLWENAARWRPEARLGTWLHTICYNRSVDRLRRRRNFVAEGELDALADAAELADGRLVRGEAARSVRETIERLPPRQRSAVYLFHFEDLSQGEAARIMGVTEAAFESLLARARRQMRAWLSAAGADDE